MDFLMAPGWRDDGYPRDAKIHGNLPKHFEHPKNHKRFPPGAGPCLPPTPSVVLASWEPCFPSLVASRF
jgi:hypothetical protein